MIATLLIRLSPVTYPVGTNQPKAIRDICASCKYPKPVGACNLNLKRRNGLQQRDGSI